MTDTRERRMRTLATRIRNCTACDGMNIPQITQAAPGYGSAQSPVMIVGQSLCGPCMATQIPFTGGSGRFLDRALDAATLTKESVFTTNVVHCHPPNNRPSLPHEIDNCRPYLAREIAIVAPRLIICLGRDARAALELLQPAAPVLPWPFNRPRKTTTDSACVLFAPHPSWIARQPRADQDAYVVSLAAALRWAFAHKRDT
ncbi:MAG: uracil-DNA glycosylase [Mycobacterium sp.]|nr:uracil-DNA glycosylase [Mycobacterium sp.]